MDKKIKIAPSLLSADFTDMAGGVRKMEAAGADLLHCDIMDGVFVPNISFGPKMVEDIRKVTKLPLDVHLMIINPEKYVERFAAAGADYLTVHLEAVGDKAPAVLEKIRSLNVKCGLVISPDTPAESLFPYLSLCDMILIMSVYPGFGGQKFIPAALKKAEILAKRAGEVAPGLDIEIDGGINFDNSRAVIGACVNILVAGNTVFTAPDPAEAIKRLRG